MALIIHTGTGNAGSSISRHGINGIDKQWELRWPEMSGGLCPTRLGCISMHLLAGLNRFPFACRRFHCAKPSITSPVANVTGNAVIKEPGLIWPAGSYWVFAKQHREM